MSPVQPMPTASYLSLVVSIGLLSAARGAAAESQVGADTLVRLSPARFSSAPANVRDVLTRRGCLVPQDTGRVGPRNVIRHDFGGPRTIAWAALCSRRGVTTLLVIHVGASLRVDSLGAGNDDPGRSIVAAAPARMWRQAAFYAESPRDTAGLRRLLTHHGIEDGSGCCSVIHFWDGRRWRELPGSD